MDPVVSGVWRVLHTVADPGAALLGVVFRRGNPYEVILVVTAGTPLLIHLT